MEVTGRVIRIIASDNVDHTFRVQTPKEKLTLSYKGFLPIKNCDRIYCQINNNQIIKPPMVVIEPNRQTMLNFFVKTLNIAMSIAIEIYNDIADLVNETEIYNYISSIAESWHRCKKTSLLAMFGPSGYDYPFRILLNDWYQQYNLRQLYLLGLTKKEIESYPDTTKNIYDMCLSNPYKIMTIDLYKCQAILERQNLKPSSTQLKSGQFIRLLYSNLINKKWTSLPSKKNDFNLDQYDIVYDFDSYYLKEQYAVETSVVKYLLDQINDDKSSSKSFIHYPASYERTDLSDEQKHVIYRVLDHSISIIAAAAGHGKTACIKEVVYNLTQRQLNFKLTSFTGKAVENLRLITNKKAQTIHRLIYNSKLYSEKIDVDFLIIDEATMVTTALFNELIHCFGHVPQLLLVGDTNQLQPIEAGYLFYEMIQSKVIPVYNLTKNYRASDGILSNANNIIHNLPLVENDVFNIVEGNLESVLLIVKGYYEAGIPAKEVKIICPYNDYQNVKILKLLNDEYQSIYNGGQKGVIDSFGRTFKVNDRVLLQKNLHDYKIFNGSEGIVKFINATSIAVQFGDQEHSFRLHSSKEDDEFSLTVNKLSHAYAITVDKSQGSQYPYIIGYIPNDYDSSFINKNRLYTLITRASKMVWLVCGSKRILFNALKRNEDPPHDNLSKRLQLKN